MKFTYLNTITVLSLICAGGLIIVSWMGSFVSSTYARDAASMAAQGIGQDLVDLFLVVPLFLVTLFFLRKGNKTAVLLFSGIVFYILYSFFIYAFGVHFNQLFLLYCLVLGTSLYLFILILTELTHMEVENWFSEKLNRKPAAIFFLVTAALFYLLWLKDVLPGVINNTIPKSVSDYNLLVNPVHVLDMAIALPGLITASILLLRKRRMGFILTAVFLVFIIILTIALAAMVVLLKIKGINEDLSVMAVFLILALISGVLLGFFIRNIKN